MKTNKFATLIVLTGAVSLSAAAAWPDVKTDQAIAKAEEQFAKRPDDAIKSLVKLASSTPSVEAYLALARLQEMNGNGDDAAASIAKAVEVSASATPTLKAQALATSAQLTMRNGTGAAALDQATKAVAAEKNGTSLGTLASVQARVGDVKAAHASADAAIAASATSSVAHTGKGDAFQASGQAAEAVASYRKAIELDPKNVTAHVGLTYALVTTNKATEAKAIAQKATEIDKSSGPAFAALGYAISAEKKFDGNDPSWTDAIAQAQQGVFLAPKNAHVQVIVAKLFEARGNYDQALVAYAAAIAADPGYTPAKSAVILANFRKGDIDGALKAAAELVKANPESPEANKMYGEFLARKGQYKEAIPPLEKATAAMPTNADAWAILAHSYHSTRSFEDGKNAYAKAVELNPTNNDIKSNYGLLLGMAGDPEKGVQVLSALVATPGYKSAAGFANYGYVLSRTKPPRAPEAIAAYTKAIQIEPTNAGLHFGMGWAQYYGQHYPEAIAAFEKSATMDKQFIADTRGPIGWSQYFIAVNADGNKPDFTATKAAVAAAEAAGRPNTKLADAVTRYEKAIADGQVAAAKAAAAAAAKADADDAIDLGKLTRQLQKGTSQQRVDAAHELAAGGADAAEVLAYAVETDPLVQVKQAAFDSLKRMGQAARKAKPALTRWVSTPPLAKTNATPDEVRVEMMDADLRRDVRDLILKLK